jgi:hypothetical protein
VTIHGPGSPIYASEIQAEFGGGNPFYLSNYYAGGPYVPAGTTGSNGAVPSSGYISLWHFYGTSKFLQQFAIGVANNGFGGYGYDHGHGTISPTTFSPTGGQAILALCWLNFGLPGGSSGVQLMVAGLPGNGGWGSIHINGTLLTRGSAYFYQDGGANWTSWNWNGVGNIFGTSGTIYATVYP